MSPHFKALLGGLALIALLAFSCQARGGVGVTVSNLAEVAEFDAEVAGIYLAGARDGISTMNALQLTTDAAELVSLFDAWAENPDCLYSMDSDDLVAVIRLRARTSPDELVSVTLMRLAGGCQ